MSKDVVSKTIKLFKLHGVIINHKRRGRPQKTSEKLDRLIKRVSQKNPTLSANQIIGELGEVEVSSRTIQRRLEEQGRPGRRICKKPQLSKKILKLD